MFSNTEQNTANDIDKIFFFTGGCPTLSDFGSSSIKKIQNASLK